MNPHKRRKSGEPITASQVKYEEQLRVRYWRRVEYRLLAPMINRILKLAEEHGAHTAK